jgi:hypothetical protein
MGGSIASVLEERGKALNKGFDIMHDFRINKNKQLATVAGILIEEGIMRESLLKTFSYQGTIVENWDNQVILKYLKLPYEDRVKIAAGMLVGELDRLDFINTNNIEGNV